MSVKVKQSYSSLPDGCVLRQAISADIWSIRFLVLRAKLDPTQIRWEQFWVIECSDDIVACGQLRDYSGVKELGSLVVLPAWRGRGLGSILTQHLITSCTQPLYLECLGDRLASFYSHFGFVPIDWQELPQPLQKKFRISQLAKMLRIVPVIFMQYQGN